MTNWMPIEEFNKKPKFGKYWAAMSSGKVRKAAFSKVVNSKVWFIFGGECHDGIESVMPIRDCIEKPLHPSKGE